MAIRVTRYTKPYDYVRIEEVRAPDPAPVVATYDSVEAALAALPPDDPAVQYLQKYRKENPTKGTDKEAGPVDAEIGITKT